MSLPATDPAPPALGRTSRHRWLVAVGWALAAAACTGGGWGGVLVVARSFYGISVLPESVSESTFALGPGCGPIGAVYGVLIGAAVGIFRGGGRRAASAFELGTLGGLFGLSAGILSLMVMAAAGPLAHPIASSSLGVGAAGFLTGLFGCLWSQGQADDAEVEAPLPAEKWNSFTAAGWAFATAFCTGGSWAATLLVMGALLGVSLPTTPPRTDITLMLVGSGAVFGLLAGICLAFRSESGERGAAIPVLGVGGALFGALVGAAGVLAAPAVGDQLHPLISSSLGMALVGFLAGPSAYAILCWTKPHPRDEAELLDEEADPPTGAKVEWLLREQKRDWHINRSLLRVLPVLLVTVWALGGAVLLAPDDVAIAFLAVGVLGLAVAFVLYRQEERLEALERRLRDRK